MLEAMPSGLYVLQRLDLHNKDQIAPGVSGDFFSTGEASRHFAANRQPLLAEKPQGVPAWRQKAEVWQRRICAPRVGRAPARRAAEYSGK